MSQNKSFVMSCKNSTCSANIDSQKQICIHVKYRDEHNNKSYTELWPLFEDTLVQMFAQVNAFHYNYYYLWFT